MSKKKDKVKEIDSNIAGDEVKSTVTLPETPKIKIEEKEDKSLEDAFAEFESESTEFSPPESGEDTPNDGTELKDLKHEQSNLFKIQMFMNFASFLLVGFNTVVLNVIFKKDISTEEMAMNQRDKDAISPYLNSPEVIQMLSKIPSWVWGIVHVEWIFISKYRHAVKMKELNKKDKTKK